MILILSLISNPSGLFSMFFRSIRNAPTTNGITVTFMFYNFFSSQQGLRGFFLIKCSQLLLHSLRVFHTSFNCWSFTRVSVTTSHLMPPGLFTVFYYYYYYYYYFTPCRFSTPVLTAGLLLESK